MNEESTSEQLPEVNAVITETANEKPSPLANTAEIPADALIVAAPVAPAPGAAVSPEAPVQSEHLVKSGKAVSGTLMAPALAVAVATHELENAVEERAAPKVVIKSPSRLKVAKAVVKPVDSISAAAESPTTLTETPETACIKETLDAASTGLRPQAVFELTASATHTVTPSEEQGEFSPAGSAASETLQDGDNERAEPGMARKSAGNNMAQPRQAPPMPDPRRRLRELLAIPDRDRSDALWDELIELEIQLAPGNRASSPHQADPARQPKQQRFSDPARRPAAAPGASRHHRPQGNVQGLPGNVHAAGNPNGSYPAAGTGTPGAAKPGKRFFKKARRGPRPADKV